MAALREGAMRFCPGGLVGLTDGPLGLARSEPFSLERRLFMLGMMAGAAQRAVGAIASAAAVAIDAAIPGCAGRGHVFLWQQFLHPALRSDRNSVGRKQDRTRILGRENLLCSCRRRKNKGQADGGNNRKYSLHYSLPQITGGLPAFLSMRQYNTSRQPFTAPAGQRSLASTPRSCCS